MTRAWPEAGLKGEIGPKMTFQNVSTDEANVFDVARGLPHQRGGTTGDLLFSITTRGRQFQRRSIKSV
jgi:hypothetical protein